MPLTKKVPTFTSKELLEQAVYVAATAVALAADDCLDESQEALRTSQMLGYAATLQARHDKALRKCDVMPGFTDAELSDYGLTCRRERTAIAAILRGEEPKEDA